MKLLTKKHQKSCKNLKNCFICKKENADKYTKDKKQSKVRDHCHYTGECRDAAHGICSLTYNVSEEISIVSFHNGFKHNYHFIINELLEEFER